MSTAWEMHKTAVATSEAKALRERRSSHWAARRAVLTRRRKPSARYVSGDLPLFVSEKFHATIELVCNDSLQELPAVHAATSIRVNGISA